MTNLNDIHSSEMCCSDAQSTCDNSSILMPVAEKFVSINGEGQCTGKLAAFIRFTGCNLRCTWCDTMWANGSAAGEAAQESSIADLVAWVRTTGVECITLTGGEPTLQPALPQLISALLAEPGPSGRGLRVEIETNGSVDLAKLVDLRRGCEGACRGLLTFTVDWKLPVSGQEGAMLPANFAMLDMRDTVKFVCGSTSDLDRMLDVACNLKLPGRVPVYVSPVFGSIKPSDIVEFAIAHKLTWATVQLQMHKIIWPNTERGV